MIFNRRQNRSIEKLTEELILTGTISIEMFNHTFDGLIEKKEELLNKVIENLTPKVNEREKYVERKCIEFLALWKPNARDLRISTMLLMMNKEIARIAELCDGIAIMAKLYLKRDESHDLSKIKELFSKTGDILLAANRSFTFEEIYHSQEVFSGYSVLKMDKEINILRDDLVRKLIAESKNHPEKVENIYILIRIIQKLERIGDHCKNIASEVVYIVSGRLKIKE